MINKPILKWVGGKQKSTPYLYKYVPKNFNNYIEPFMGGGAFYFGLCPKNSILNDINPELMNFYKIVKRSPEKLILEVSSYKNTKNDFYRIRSADFRKLDAIEKAARFYFLNKTCFGGLYRVNSNGNFNVPYAGYKNRKICDPEGIYQASKILENSKLFNKDYREILLEKCKKKDLIYLDPPYLGIGEDNIYDRYNVRKFTYKDHCELAEIVNYLDGIGCHIVLSNSNIPEIKKLYGNYHIQEVTFSRTLNNRKLKKESNELIVTNQIKGASKFVA